MRLIGPLARIVFSGCVSAGLRTEGLDNWADHWLAPSWEKSYIYLLILQSCWRMLMFEKSSVSLKKTQPTKKPTKHKNPNTTTNPPPPPETQNNLTPRILYFCILFFSPNWK